MNNDDTTDITKYPIDAQAFSDQIADTMYHFAIGINKVIIGLNEMCNSLGKALTDSFLPVLAVLEERNKALSYACVHQPKMYHYAVYSKKYRIREKYMKRIIHLYRKDNNHDDS